MTARWNVGERTVSLERPVVMGIVNVTPDSFSDGGRFLESKAAVEHGLRLVEEGADVLDVGGESTRPGSRPVSVEEEWRRIEPVVRGLVEQCDVPLSVDTRHAEVARRALEAGAHIVNDVSALADPAMASVVAAGRAGLVLMHMQGEPGTMQAAPRYGDVVGEVARFLGERARSAERAGIERARIVVDPGLGFGKRTGKGVEDNLQLLKRLGEIVALGYPVLVGASRKSFVGNVLGLPLGERLEGSLAAAAVAAMEGASIVRVHDVRATRRVVDFVHAVRVQPNP